MDGASAACDQGDLQDVFGNLIATATFAAPTAELTIMSRLSVEQLAVVWPVFRIARSRTPSRSSTRPTRSRTLVPCVSRKMGMPKESWRRARSFVGASPTDTLSLLKYVNSGHLSFVSYRTRHEEGTQSPLETLALASGSCWDIAALFIAAARHLGLGARAVSGYLYDPQVQSEDSGWTHVLAEVYLPDAGWIAFDPTHRSVGGANLIPVAVARSNRQIMPIAGGYTGAPEDFFGMDVMVSVTRTDDLRRRLLPTSPLS